jgi:hypothetical protein
MAGCSEVGKHHGNFIENHNKKIKHSISCNSSTLNLRTKQKNYYNKDLLPQNPDISSQ